MTALSASLLSAAPSDVVPTPLVFLDKAGLDAVDARLQACAASHQFTAKSGKVLLLTSAEGALEKAYIGIAGSAVEQVSSARLMAAVAPQLPPGIYRLDCADMADAELLNHAISWAMGQYSFDRYRDREPQPLRQLVLGDDQISQQARHAVSAQVLVRDLINTPAAHMGPAQLEQAVQTVAVAHEAEVFVVRGDKLLDAGFPAIHAVGRAAAPADAPRLIELNWQPAEPDADLPLVVLVGKGVCFDSGGLNIKTGNYMALMKKDMGGAAHVLGLADLIMRRKLPVRLKLLIPAVENAISAGAFRPGDVLETRKGISVEVGNTDAEGRLVLCDALAYASESKPDLILDYATLTGAARIALGPDLVPAYTDDDKLWQCLQEASSQTHDPLWRMPLYQPYLSMMNSPIADMNNIGEGGFAGSILAGLYLQQFVDITAWAHFDIYGWSPANRPGQQKGAAVQALMAGYHAIESYFDLA